MTSPCYAAVGWELQAPEISVCDPRAPGALAEAAVIFLSIEAVGGLWTRAVGHPVRSFRSSQHEAAAWRGVRALVDQLRRAVERGSLIVARLDLPGPRCRVQLPLHDRPLVENFPSAAEIHAYDVLAVVHPLLDEVSRGLVELSGGDFRLTGATHPLSVYLDEFAWQVAPAVALESAPLGSEVLAQTPAGRPIAVASEQIILLPRLARPDAGAEGVALVRAVERLGSVAVRWPAVKPDARTPLGIGPLGNRDRQLAEQMAHLQARYGGVMPGDAAGGSLAVAAGASAATESLSDGVVEDAFIADVARVLAILGFRQTSDRGQAAVWFTKRDALIDDQGRRHQVVRGRLYVPGHGSREVEFVGRAIGGAASSAGAGSDSKPAPLDAVIDSDDLLVVPIVELVKTASAAALDPAGGAVAARLRERLVRATRIFHFEPGEVVLEQVERDVLIR